MCAAAEPRIVIIGAGIVGCALADELSQRGRTKITVLERGPLFETGGSTSHAPGLVFQTNASKTMTEFAAYTARKFSALTLGGEPCFNQVGGLEIATSPERMHELERKSGWAEAWGVPARLLTPEQCVDLHPMLDVTKLYGGFHIPSDGLSRTLRAAEAQAERARGLGVRFEAHQPVTAITQQGGRVTSVRTSQDEYGADIVISCAGVWGPAIGDMVGVPVPLVPMAHQYAITTALPSMSGTRLEESTPILRHQDKDLYFRHHFDRVGIGAYGHRPMPVPVDEIPSNAMRPFTEDDFDPWWREAITLLPELAETKVDSGFNGLFSFTPDGMPLLGESPDVRGFWLAEAVWITHSAGVARAMTEWLVDGQPKADLHACDINRFEELQHAPAYVLDRGCQSFVEVYDIIHPQQPKEEPRPLRVSPFFARQQELGAYFLEANGWERAHWYEDNARRLRGRDIPDRGEWAGRYWSPIAGAEALVTRERVALYDMTSLQRMEVSGPGALDFLQQLTTNQLDKPVGRVTYTLLLNSDGGVRSDLTVARLAEDRFQVAGNGRLDLAWLARRLPADGSVHLRDITAGTCCIGVWGPLARDLVQPLTETDFSHEAFRYFHARQAFVEHVPVTALRVSYVGELGWELYTTADMGLRLWDTLWEAGQQFGLIAGGRSAFSSLRLEKGYRAWGTDMTTEHTPYEAGVGFAVKLDKGDFIGRSALVEAPEPARRLTALTSEDPLAVVTGGEPVFVSGEAVGYVTSADYGYTISRAIAYAWLPTAATEPGTSVEVGYFGQRLPYVVTPEPLFDPGMSRLRR